MLCIFDSAVHFAPHCAGNLLYEKSAALSAEIFRRELICLSLSWIGFSKIGTATNGLINYGGTLSLVCLTR
jgi:hypothetical protein